MVKKNYDSPTMKEVKIQVEQDMLAGSCSVVSGVGSDAVVGECACPSANAICDID